MTDKDKERGSPSPLISVIVRTTGRPELAEALASLAAQQYRPLEVILVDANGRGLPEAVARCGDLPVIAVSTGEPLRRPVAANRGLSASHGAFLLFLDDDDWIDPDHISSLVSALLAEPRCLAAYSSTRKADRHGNPLPELFDRDYDPVLLKRDNYIPIHAMLFARALLEAGCRFDETLDIYEDWDFWLQASRYTGFLHLDRVSAYYRQGGDSDTDIHELDTRFQSGHPLTAARSRIYHKWREVWDGSELNALLGRTVGRSEFDTLASALKQKDRQLQERNHQLQEMDAYAGSLRAILDKSSREAAALAQQADALEKTLQRERREHAISDLHRDRHIRELETRLTAIYAMWSWRLMGPFRRVARLLDQALVFPAKQKVHFWRYGTELTRPGADSFGELPPEQELPGVELTADAKLRYREEATNNLRQFLDSGATLTIPRTEQPLVSILLVLYNQAPLTLLCIESILKFAPAPYELVIVNNASADESGELLDRLVNVTLLNNDNNEGFVKAVNKGVEQCRGRYLLLLNNDAMLHLYAIESAIRTLETTADAGAVGGRILLLDGSLQEAGSMIFSDGSCLGDYCSGAFLLCQTTLFRELGGFDLDYAPAYYEDSDFCVRLQERGLKVIYDPAAVITHYEFASSGGQHKASQLQDKHRQVLLRKHPGYLAGQADSGTLPLLCRTANRQPNLLVIDDRVPHAGLGSGYPRCREMLTVLAGAGFNVSLYPLQFPHESWADTYATLPGNIEVLLEHGTAQLSAFLNRRRGFYQTVLVSRIHNMRALNELLAAQPDLLDGVSIIYDAEAITAPRDIMQRELRGETVPARERYELVEQEIAAARTASQVVAVSDQEAALYAEHGFHHTVVLGHCLQPTAGTKPFAERRGLLFVGALHDEDSPNVDSLHWFIGAVWPLLKSVHPNLELHVVGDNRALSLTQLQGPGIRFHGRLDDIGPLYDNARVFIAPTRFAAGIPHKVHEAAAHGVPCVTTRLLARQLSWESGTQLMAGDSPREFADLCLTLLDDQTAWEATRSAALKAVTRECSPERFRKVLLDLLSVDQ
jgi:GT2 family glycosyltransferase